MNRPLTDSDARRLLDDAEVIPALQLALAEAKEIQAECLGAGVPAILGKDDHCTQGCSPKVLLLIRADDVDAVRAILSRKWQALLRRHTSRGGGDRGGRRCRAALPGVRPPGAARRRRVRRVRPAARLTRRN